MTGLISVDDALGLLLKHQPRKTAETIPLKRALGRRLATPIVAQRTHPPAAMSAMDGYAVRLADVAAPGAHLRVVGEAPAGRPFEEKIGAGEAVRIFTGSVIPGGADTVIIQENVERDGDHIRSAKSYSEPAHIRAAGLDFKQGDRLIEAGTRLRGEHLSVTAASNNATVEVQSRIRVGLISNGDELRPPGSQLAPGEIINSNPFGLSGLIDAWGGEAIDLGIARDSVDAIVSLIDQSEGIDVYLPIGGASVGDHDHMRTAFSARGFEPIFEKVAVRPGKPTWFSRSGDALALGLPGNPASAMVCANLFLAPLLGLDWPSKMIPAKLTSPIQANGPREHFMRARLEVSDEGGFVIDPYASQDSSLLRPFLTNNALLRRLPRAPALSAGETVQALPIGSLFPVA